MNTGGWIKIDRSIKDHWIYQDPTKLKWWIDLLLSVNHSEKKVIIGNKLFKCDRGQSMQSLQTWALQWNVSKDKVRNFFTLLENDNMILRENLGKTTRITICNYASYQDVPNDNSPQTHLKPNDNSTSNQTITQPQTHLKPNDNSTSNSPQTHPNKNDKNDKNIKNTLLTQSTKKDCLCENENLKSENEFSEPQFSEPQKVGFVKPNLEEIKNYLREQNLTSFTAEDFFYFYESKGWLIGNQKMRDWKAAVRRWESRRREVSQKVTSIHKPTNIDIQDLWQ